MKMRARRRTNQKGIALVLTLMVISILAALIFTFYFENQVELEIASNLRYETQAYFIARSGIEAGTLLLSLDGQTSDRPYDSLDEEWAQFAQYAAQSGFLFEAGLLTGGIEDMERRIDVNQLVKNGTVVTERLTQMVRLFDMLGIKKEILAAIIDWLDPDSETFFMDGLGYGAEQDYYDTLNPSRICKNGLLDDISELRLIKGITDEIYVGTEEQPGLKDVLAVRTSGKININTASLLMLRTLSDELMTSSRTQGILDRRESTPFKSLQELDEVIGLSPSVHQEISRLAGVTSQYFLLDMEGEVNGVRKCIRCTVGRSGSSIARIFWQVE